MEDRFIKLNCANCGAKLEVYDDMERFACGYCGTEMLVQRRGGTVALKAVTEAIKKVQIGTDKTAAELALVRLEKELEQLKADSVQMQNRLSGRKTEMGCAVVLAIPLIFLLQGVAGENAGAAVVLGVAIIGGVVWAVKQNTKNREEWSQALIESKSKMEQTEQEIARTRKTLEG